MKTGMYDMTNEQYHKTDGASATNLIDVIQYSEAHAWHWKSNPVQPTEAMLDGTRLHTAVLEPELFDKTYLACNGDKRTNEYKRAVEDNPDKILVPQKKMDLTLRMRDVVLNNKTCRAILNGAIKEKSFYAKDPLTGTLIKARPDIINTEACILADLKKTTQADLYHAKLSIKSYYYMLQAAFHMDVVNLVGMTPTIKDSVFIFVEDSEPFGVSVIAPSLKDLQKGFDLYREALDRWAKCQETGVWPSYPEGIIETEIYQEVV